MQILNDPQRGPKPVRDGERTLMPPAEFAPEVYRLHPELSYQRRVLPKGFRSRYDWHVNGEWKPAAARLAIHRTPGFYGMTWWMDRVEAALKKLVRKD